MRNKQSVLDNLADLFLDILLNFLRINPTSRLPRQQPGGTQSVDNLAHLPGAAHNPVSDSSGEGHPDPHKKRKRRNNAFNKFSSREKNKSGQDGYHHDAASHSPGAKTSRPAGSSTATPTQPSPKQQPEALSGASGP